MYEPIYGNPMLNPYYNAQQQQIMQQQSSMKTEVLRVNGENGANAINLAPNSSILALDMSGLMVWLVTTDGAGYKTVAPYDILPHQIAPAPDYSDLNARLTKLEEMMNNGYSGNPATTRRKSGSGKSSDESE